MISISLEEFCSEESLNSFESYQASHCTFSNYIRSIWNFFFARKYKKRNKAAKYYKFNLLKFKNIFDFFNSQVSKNFNIYFQHTLQKYLDHLEPVYNEIKRRNPEN